MDDQDEEEEMKDELIIPSDIQSKDDDDLEGGDYGEEGEEDDHFPHELAD